MTTADVRSRSVQASCLRRIEFRPSMVVCYLVPTFTPAVKLRPRDGAN